MNTVTIDVRTLEGSLADFASAWKTGSTTEPRISFETPEKLWKTFTPKRWALLRAMTGKGAMPLRQIARTVGRDVKAVHTDVHALVDAGIIDRTEAGFLFPFDGIHVDFTVMAHVA